MDCSPDLGDYHDVAEMNVAGEIMSMLEVLLVVMLLAAFFTIFRLYQRQLILRHKFIESSDWCARKIVKMAADATDCIVDMAVDQSKLYGEMITREEAEGDVPNTILLAVSEWVKQKEAFQSCLSRNGIEPLGIDDWDLILVPKFSGYKS